MDNSLAKLLADLDGFVKKREDGTSLTFKAIKEGEEVSRNELTPLWAHLRMGIWADYGAHWIVPKAVFGEICHQRWLGTLLLFSRTKLKNCCHTYCAFLYSSLVTLPTPMTNLPPF